MFEKTIFIKSSYLNINILYRRLIISNLKKYIYLLNLFGGILFIIAFFTPAMYVDMDYCTFYYWYWGLTYCNPDFVFNKITPDLVISGTTMGIIILVSGCNLIISVNKIRTEKKSIKTENKKLITFSILPILIGFFWILGIDTIWRHYFINPDYNVWDFYSFGFGLIGVFIGGGISLLGTILGFIIFKNYTYTYKRPALPKKEVKQLNMTKSYCPHCPLALKLGLKECPECGKSFK